MKKLKNLFLSLTLIIITSMVAFIFIKTTPTYTAHADSYSITFAEGDYITKKYNGYSGTVTQEFNETGETPINYGTVYYLEQNECKVAQTGWSKNSDGSTLDYSLNGSINIETLENITLYPCFIYKIKFKGQNDNNGSQFLKMNEDNFNNYGFKKSNDKEFYVEYDCANSHSNFVQYPFSNANGIFYNTDTLSNAVLNSYWISSDYIHCFSVNDELYITIKSENDENDNYLYSYADLTVNGLSDNITIKLNNSSLDFYASLTNDSVSLDLTSSASNTYFSTLDPYYNFNTQNTINLYSINMDGYKYYYFPSVASIDKIRQTGWSTNSSTLQLEYECECTYLDNEISNSTLYPTWLFTITYEGSGNSAEIDGNTVYSYTRTYNLLDNNNDLYENAIFKIGTSDQTNWHSLKQQKTINLGDPISYYKNDILTATWDNKAQVIFGYMQNEEVIYYTGDNATLKFPGQVFKYPEEGNYIITKWKNVVNPNIVFNSEEIVNFVEIMNEYNMDSAGNNYYFDAVFELKPFTITFKSGADDNHQLILDGETYTISGTETTKSTTYNNGTNSVTLENILFVAENGGPTQIGWSINKPSSPDYSKDYNLGQTITVNVLIFQTG